MKFKITGKSLVELLEEYGLGEKGFYSAWWKDEFFAKEKPEAGEYEIDLDKKKYTNLTYEEQKKELPEGFDFPHAAVLAEAILNHYHKTGERLMEKWYSRTLNKSSDGDCIHVGDFDCGGLDVNDIWDRVRYGSIGVADTRKLNKKMNIPANDPVLKDGIENFKVDLKDSHSIYKHLVYNPHTKNIHVVIQEAQDEETLNSGLEWQFVRSQPITEYEWVAIFEKWIY